MADISITAGSVLPSSAASLASGTAGEAITAGQAVYVDSTDSGKIKLADNDVLAKIGCVGIALNGASAGQPVDYCTRDPQFTLGGTIASGVSVFLTSVPGGIGLVAEVGSADYGVFLGIGVGSNKIFLNPTVGGQVS
jgi:hypothetical protein